MTPVPTPPAVVRTRGHWIFIGFVLIAGFLLFTEHRAHLFGALPFALLAACLVLHLLGHGGHDRDTTEGDGT